MTTSSKPIDGRLTNFTGFESDQYKVLAEHVRMPGKILPVYMIIRRCHLSRLGQKYNWWR